MPTSPECSVPASVPPYCCVSNSIPNSYENWQKNWRLNEKSFENKTGRKECYGEICQLDFKIYTVWCRILRLMNPCYIYIDIQKCIVWFDCGCHQKLNHNKYNKHHSKFKQCSKNVKRLLNCSLIGFMKNTSMEEGAKYFQSDKCIFNDSEFVYNRLKCKNCQILLSLKLDKWLSKFLDSNSILHQDHTEFSRILFIYIISNLLKYCLSSANTASFILKNDNYIRPLLKFILFAVHDLSGFHRKSTDEDEHDAILFKYAFIAFTQFLKLLINHSSKFSLKWWNIINDGAFWQRNSIGNKLFIEIKDTIQHFIYQLGNNVVKNMYLINNKNLEKNLILPLIIFLYLFQDKYNFYIGKWMQQLSINSHNNYHQRWLLKQLQKNKNLNNQNVNIIQYLKTIKIFSSYLMIRDKKLKWKYVKCQWYKCKKRKRDDSEWKKCSGCRIAYYCCRKCQKLDWNRGHHKRICHHNTIH